MPVSADHPVVLRALRPGETGPLLAVFSQLSPRSAYLRFHAGMPRLTPAMLCQLAAVRPGDHEVVVAERAGRPVGIGRFVRDAEHPSLAELAVEVADQEHGRGVGSLLVEATARRAQAAGVSRLTAAVLSENATVRAWLRRHGAVARDDDVWLVPSRWPTLDADVHKRDQLGTDAAAGSRNCRPSGPSIDMNQEKPGKPAKTRNTTQPGESAMSFQDAIRVCLQRKYADFTGRARRSEYWFFFLFTALAGLVGSILDSLFNIRSGTYGGTGPIQGLIQLALLLPGLAVGARRLHDTGRSGWWLLIALIPVVGWIILLVFFLQDSQPDNKYGPNPKGVGQGYGPGPSEMPSTG